MISPEDWDELAQGQRREFHKRMREYDDMKLTMEEGAGRTEIKEKALLELKLYLESIAREICILKHAGKMCYCAAQLL